MELNANGIYQSKSAISWWYLGFQCLDPVLSNLVTGRCRVHMWMRSLQILQTFLVLLLWLLKFEFQHVESSVALILLGIALFSHDCELHLQLANLFTLVPRYLNSSKREPKTCSKVLSYKKAQSARKHYNVISRQIVVLPWFQQTWARAVRPCFTTLYPSSGFLTCKQICS